MIFLIVTLSPSLKSLDKNSTVGKYSCIILTTQCGADSSHTSMSAWRGLVACTTACYYEEMASSSLHYSILCGKESAALKIIV